MVKYFFSNIFFCCFLLHLCAQTDSIGGKSVVDGLSSAAPIYTGKVKQFTADNLGNVYVLTSAGLLIKLNGEGDSLNVFNDVRRYGVVSSMDATNPMKLILFYRDFSTVVMLDRNLNRVNTIDLRKQGVFQASAVGLSYDNNLWVFDEQTSQLKKINESGNLLSETVDLRQVVDFIPSPMKIIDRDGLVYLIGDGKGLLVFDYYGALKNTFALAGVKDIQVIENFITGRRANMFVRYSPATFQFSEAVLPASLQHAKQIYVSRQGIYALTDSGVERYRYH